jgi:hypothetical protein
VGREAWQVLLPPHCGKPEGEIVGIGLEIRAPFQALCYFDEFKVTKGQN